MLSPSIPDRTIESMRTRARSPRVIGWVLVCCVVAAFAVVTPASAVAGDRPSPSCDDGSAASDCDDDVGFAAIASSTTTPVIALPTTTTSTTIPRIVQPTTTTTPTTRSEQRRATRLNDHDFPGRGGVDDTKYPSVVRSGGDDLDAPVERAATVDWRRDRDRVAVLRRPRLVRRGTTPARRGCRTRRARRADPARSRGPSTTSSCA